MSQTIDLNNLFLCMGLLLTSMLGSAAGLIMFNVIKRRMYERKIDGK